MLPSINTPSVWGKCHKKPLHVLHCVIFLLSLQYYFSCTLYRALPSKSMSLSQCSVGNIVVKLYEAIEHLYSERFLHRGIKSDSIILTEVNNMYRPMLIDFAKAISLSDAPFKTAAHDFSLTPTYSFRNMPQILCFHLG